MSHHHHAADHAHPSPAMPVSLLRMSALQRLIAALAVSALLWVTVWWALT
jgi:hypothetical protein